MTPSASPPRDVVVIGASAGGIQALQRILSDIPLGFPGVIAVVLHRAPIHGDALARVITDSTSHSVVEPADGDPLSAGGVYLAPSDQHLLLTPTGFRVTRGPKEHFTRPAIDPTFRSAAESYGSRVAGVLLTGGGHDGASGLLAIREAGGVTIVQHPDDAATPAMPRWAIRRAEPDYTPALSEIPAVITSLMNGRRSRR